uniref:Cytochrome c domain-containing protein n=2 Tax=Polytomella TaxID=3049 RepID=A0A7S0V9L0_9CHLO|nr:mitochondrial cytochrome c1 precursor [Polytomella sp. Pringsheim 198.80]|mmetsp:Transcript_27954/g.51635  ORF Transcript_27954/g.51635 Transcript_27954/m.51635 type:complete len:310 (+) Transcript_27954:119-1048(+)|eukprot:CAMPEP_0175045618 /NCGR_PEP_ID=MMETSP0052_2-20121109/4535_1 /TAXON_ID=51329 ORGANISM="Polytomella parva, Strain SAG 63-3" /NCGR_SAMPLE_ID=MMETSP0052_2 /ASSEMBLY_ACC=CAM_ASM_000194 /LENGTH=309 /DNA_ID=CAMNT_0016309193 /DNA_START=75 /DNA_END=1004 /DNA_ORIENTATION=+
MQSFALLRALKGGFNGSSQLVKSVPAMAMSTVAANQEETASKASQLAAAFGGVVAGLVGASVVASATEAGDGLHPVSYPWSHEGMASSFDHSAIRRGHQVYQQVCAACHSMNYTHWRQLVGICYTEDEAKALAAETEVVDGPNDEGEMFTRAGRLFDKFPNPFANEQAARFSNGGAFPPDLSLITGARHDGQNYVFALLTGYREPPAGIDIREGLYYNPYFPGGAIAMPKILVDEGVEYDDGTPANASQQAKDVVTFLAWAFAPYQDDQRVMGLKALFMTALMTGFAIYSKRLRWSSMKSQKIVMDVVN